MKYKFIYTKFGTVPFWKNLIHLGVLRDLYYIFIILQVTKHYAGLAKKIDKNKKGALHKIGEH